MKTSIVALAALVLPLVACGGAASSADPTAGESDELKRDACTKPALAAAEAEYGNAPDGTKVKVLTKSKKYRVTVGIGNPEDGAHDYYVEFPAGCSSTPKVTEVPFLPHPLRDAAHAAYDTILWGHGDTLASASETGASGLPKAAKQQFDSWTRAGNSNCSAVKAYEVKVHGASTFAVACDVVGDSIKLSFGIWDDKGSSVDQASVYGLSSGVGDKGVSWQNETFQVQD